MICPHCRKAIPSPTSKIPDETRREVLRLHKEGFTCRDIQDLLRVSFSSAARIIRESKPKTKEKPGP